MKCRPSDSQARRDNPQNHCCVLRVVLGQVEKQLGEAQSQVIALRQQVADKSETLTQMNIVVEGLRAERATCEESLRMFKDSNVRLQGTARLRHTIHLHDKVKRAAQQSNHLLNLSVQLLLSRSNGHEHRRNQQGKQRDFETPA